MGIYTRTAALLAPRTPTRVNLDVQSQPILAGALIFCADVAAFLLSAGLSVVARWALGGDYHLSTYWRLWPVLGLLTATFALFGLYPGITLNAVSELRRATAAITAVFLMLSGVTFMFRDADTYSRSVFFSAWLLSVVLTPIGRALVRKQFAERSWWGYPVVVFGSGETARMVLDRIISQPELGFRVKAVADASSSAPASLYGIPVFHDLEEVAVAAEAAGVTHAIVAMPELAGPSLLSLLETHAASFPNVLFVPDMSGISSLGVEAKDLCRQLVLEVRRSLLRPGAQFAKRVIDLCLAIPACIVLLPVFASIYLLLKLESRAPAFYSQTRVGRGGENFRIWKFRSMVPNAQEVLADYLARNPELRSEWERDQKLRDDPRVTRLGRMLRKTSLDELPQLWNVLAGDMSLVGPRPIVQNEVLKYGPAYDLYRQVLPGITGMWQISGRNNTTYRERIALDSYYVRNWSPWFDVYILSRTVKVVLLREGAF